MPAIKYTTGHVHIVYIRLKYIYSKYDADGGINQGRILGGALGARATRGHQRGAKRKKKGKGKKERGEKRGKKEEKKGIRKKKGKKEGARKKKEGKKVKSIWQEGRHAVSSASRGSREENVSGAKITEKRTRGAPCSFKCKQRLQRRNVRGAKLTGKRTRGAPCSFKCKQGLQGRKRQRRQIDLEKNERGAMQFQVQAGAPGKKTSEAPNWLRKEREGRHAVSSASRGSSEENVSGAKLTEKRSRGAPCSFKCKQRLQGRKRQGRQIDGEKDERGAMQVQVQAAAPRKKTSGAPNWRRKGKQIIELSNLFPFRP